MFKFHTNEEQKDYHPFKKTIADDAFSSAFKIELHRVKLKFSVSADLNGDLNLPPENHFPSSKGSQSWFRYGGGSDFDN